VSRSGERGSASLDCSQNKSRGVGCSWRNFQVMRHRFRIAWVKEGLAVSLQNKQPTATRIAPRLGVGYRSLAIFAPFSASRKGRLLGYIVPQVSGGSKGVAFVLEPRDEGGGALPSGGGHVLVARHSNREAGSGIT